MAVVLESRSGFDPWFLGSLLTLLALGLVMVTSASLAFSEGFGLPAEHFALRHLVYLSVGIIGCGITSYIPLWVWRKLSVPLLMLSVFLLALVLVPGVSREVNGSLRWLFLGPISLQVSELAKLGFILYLAGYLLRQEQAVQKTLSGFLRPLILVGLLSALLLLEPDFGATVVLASTAMGMLFLAGVPLRRFLSLVLLGLVASVILSVTAPYRMQRLTSFLNPWDDQFGTGYQLTQSLIAFGRGGLWGMGLGNSVQKLLYLPEPHNDFIYAVLAEELGLVGALVVLLLFVILVWRIFALGRQAILLGNPFAGFVAYGIGLWFGFQTLINIGVNVGVLPTKGLTLPFMSYGGCSLIVSLLAVGLLLRIEFELPSKKLYK